MKFEPHLAAAEWEGFDNDDVGLKIVNRLQQYSPPLFLEGVVDRIPLEIRQAGKSLVAGYDRRQRQRLQSLCRKAGNRRAAGYNKNVKAIVGKRGSNPAGTREMSDAEQMLNVEQHARLYHAVSACHSRSNRPLSCTMLELWSK